ncbi:hypothetical protein [Georgenia ruanii]|uniref:hypothetical protein n=1 Tax=Georgenia ruanii TaxID=348442 RepID=UPI00186AC212|nr:hypothetical protein [Georgenia ruanii]
MDAEVDVPALVAPPPRCPRWAASSTSTTRPPCRRDVPARLAAAPAAERRLVAVPA